MRHWKIDELCRDIGFLNCAKTQQLAIFKNPKHKVGANHLDPTTQDMRCTWIILEAFPWDEIPSQNHHNRPCLKQKEMVETGRSFARGGCFAMTFGGMNCLGKRAILFTQHGLCKKCMFLLRAWGNFVVTGYVGPCSLGPKTRIPKATCEPPRQHPAAPALQFFQSLISFTGL